MGKRIPYQLIIRQRKDYLYVEYGGTDLSTQEIVDMINISAQTARALDTKRVLLVRNIPLIETDADRQMFASILTRMVPTDVRFAMVDKFGNDPVKSKQGLDVLRAVGWDVTEFATLAEARAWLKSGIVH